MGTKKILVGLIEENQQLKKDAEHYQQLFLEMEQRNWNLEDELGLLKQHLREIDQMPEATPRGSEFRPEEFAHKLKAEEPIAELEDDFIDQLRPEQDCGV